MELEQIFEQVRDVFSARVVVGEPVERDGVTVIPAVRVRGGGGAGGGRDDKGPGGGFGVQARPAGAWVVRGDDVRWEPAIDVTALGLAGIALVALALVRFTR